jgi:hypothetical protein
MKYRLDIVTNNQGVTIYWVLCGAYAVAKFYTLQDAENWIINNPDWDCSKCNNC